MNLQNSYCLIMIVSIALIVGCRKEEPNEPVPHPKTEYKLDDFTTAQVCSTCHPQYYQEWKGSMHHYSANDPIWRLANNGLQLSTQGRLENFCFQCHTPLGFLTGNTPKTFQFADLPDLVREGVTCDFCHVLRPPFTTTNQQVQYNLTPHGPKYATLSNPAQTAHECGYDPAYDRSEVCRPCHDLIINKVPTEMTFTEWQQSPWGAMSFECQVCHMPTYTGRAAVGGHTRENLHRHDFVGVDVAVTDFPNKPQQHTAIDSIMKNSMTMLVDAPSTADVSDSVRVSVLVYNSRIAHNVPTSVFFFRQMWLEVTVWKGTDTAYRSGYLDANGDLMDRNSAVQPNADKDLTTFGGILYKKGVETNVFELDSLVNNSLPPFGSRRSYYGFKVPSVGTWNVKVRLQFRPFGPYLFRAVNGGDYIREIPTYEMVTDEKLISIH